MGKIILCISIVVSFLCFLASPMDIDAVIGNKINDANTVYALHFYAATHGDYIRDKYKRAISNGVPVFVSECSIGTADGNGVIFIMEK